MFRLTDPTNVVFVVSVQLCSSFRIVRHRGSRRHGAFRLDVRRGAGRREHRRDRGVDLVAEIADVQGAAHAMPKDEMIAMDWRDLGRDVGRRAVHGL